MMVFSDAERRRPEAADKRGRRAAKNDQPTARLRRGRRGQHVEDEGNIRRKSTDVLAGYIREAELFQQHASVGMY
jgi:hypothetical protein